MGYAHTENYSRLEQRDINAVIPPQTSNVNPKSIPIIVSNMIPETK